MTTQPPEQQSLTKPSAKRELKDWLQGESFKRELVALLPNAMSPERFVRIAFQAVHRNPKLLRCSQESFFNCLLQLGAMGLEPDGRNAHLIPFKEECTLIVDYKGIAEILRRNHDVTSLHCDVVYTKDEYEAEQGTNQHLRHVKFKGERGVPILAYSFVRLPDGSQEFEEMTVGEVEKIRKRSKTPNEGPWVNDWDAMARKTVFRKHAKMLPLSPQTREALDRELDGDSLAFAEATPVKAAVVAEPPKRRGRPPGSHSRLAEDLTQTYGSQQMPFPDEPSEPPEMPVDKPSPVPAPAAPAAAQSEPETVSDTPLHEQVRQRVLAIGFTEAEMLKMLVSRRMAEPAFTSLAQCRAVHLIMCIDEWDNAERALREQRAKEQAS